MKKTLTTLACIALLASCGPKGPDYTGYADPFIGTENGGNCHPFACAPFGNTQAGPQTKSYGWSYCGGYLNTDKTIDGFIHNAINGTGVPDLGDILILPYCNQLRDYRSGFDKENEEAAPGFYKVYLTEAGVLAEMSATQHAAIHNFKFDKPEDAKLLIDFQNGLVKEERLVTTHIVESGQSLDDEYHISGWARSNVWVDRYYYYAIEFNHPVTTKEILPLRDPKEKAPRWVLGLDLGSDSTLVAKISVSAASIDGARRNIAKEIPGWDLEKVRHKTSAEWNGFLSRIEIEGTKEQKDIFYTTMYHLFTQPANIADYGEKPLYSTLSLWDTYRATHPLYTLIAPEYVGDMIESMLDIYDRQGCLPIWNLWGVDNYCMIGNHAIPVIVDAYLKGFRGFDSERAYEAIKTTLTTPLWKTDWHLYDKYGYFPFDFIPKESVSRTLECCYDDWCAARMAEALGYDEDCEFFMKRSGYWKNLFDPSTGLVRGKDSNGNWRTPFKPFYISHEAAAGGDYTEGNAWQYTWHVQHDIPAVIEALGGEEAFCTKLDSLFRFDPYKDGGMYSGHLGGQIGQYVHGNEPSHHVAYLYALAGKPEKTEDVIADVFRTQYFDAPYGFCGNDDCGQMSAWYIFSTLGFYPVNPCGGEYVLGVPQTTKATVHLDKGQILVIRKVGTGDHVIEITFNGKPVEGHIINQSEFKRGGLLVFDMGD